MGTSTTYFNSQDLGNDDNDEQNFGSQRESPDVNTIFNSPRKQQQPISLLEETFEDMGERHSAVFANPSAPRVDIYEDDENELNVEGEVDRVIDDIRRLSTSSTPNLKNMQFRGLGDATTPNIVVYDPETNDVMTIEKSDKQLEYEKKKLTSGSSPKVVKTIRRRPASELENLHRLALLNKFTPPKTRTRSGSKKANPQEPASVSQVEEQYDRWTSYEDKYFV